MRSLLCAAAVALVLLLAVLPAWAGDPLKGLPYYSAGTCLDQKGQISPCATLDLVRWPSVFRPGHVVALSAVVATAGKGAALSTDLWTADVAGHPSSLFAGIGAIQPDGEKKASAVFVFALRVRAGKAGQ